METTLTACKVVDSLGTFTYVNCLMYSFDFFQVCVLHYINAKRWNPFCLRLIGELDNFTLKKLLALFCVRNITQLVIHKRT